MSFADIKATARRAVHTAFAVPCMYNALDGTPATTLNVRLHTKIAISGSGGGAYATIIEGVTRAVFNREELAAKGLTLAANAQIRFPDYVTLTGPATFALDNRDAYDGPVTEKWTLATP